MGTVPTIATFSPGVLTAAYLNTIKAFSDFMLSPPQCEAFHSTLVSLTNNTFILIPLQSENFDNVQSGDTPMHDNATNNSRIVARTAGKLEITGQLGITSNATGIRSVDVRLNAAGSPVGGTSLVSPQVPALNGFTTTVPLPPKAVQMAAGDYIEIFGFQNSGGAINSATGSNTSFLRLKWIGI